MNQEQHYPYLRRALDLAQTRRGYCAPNPAVGAVLVKDGVIIGEGTHFACGEPHAEVMALRAVSGSAAGATMYVSLEPCCHSGRTPPCTAAIVAAGISSVIYGYQDPNPIVAGQGHRWLAASGVETLHIGIPEIALFYRSYTHWRTYQRPWVTAKIALSLDGKIAGLGGERLAITGPALKQHTYAGRQRCDAILTTAKTVANDDPLLNVQLSQINDTFPAEVSCESKPLYILDRQLQLTADYRIWQNNQKITVFYSAANSVKIPAALLARGVVFVPIAEVAGHLEIGAILATIGQQGVHDLWVEAGGELLSSLLEGGWVDTLQVYVAPKWLGSQAQSAFKDKIFDFEAFTDKAWRVVGEDVVCEMTRVPPSAISLNDRGVVREKSGDEVLK